MLNTDNIDGGVAPTDRGDYSIPSGLIAMGGLTLVSQRAFLTRAIWLAQARPMIR